jgi:hypothetical protein
LAVVSQGKEGDDVGDGDGDGNGDGNSDNCISYPFCLHVAQHGLMHYDPKLGDFGRSFKIFPLHWTMSEEGSQFLDWTARTASLRLEMGGNPKQI